MSKTSTTKSEAAPWDPAQAALKDVIGQGQDLYASGGFQTNPYEGNRVADFSQATQQGMQGLSTPWSGTQGANDAFGRLSENDPNAPNFDQYTQGQNAPNFDQYTQGQNAPNFDQYTQGQNAPNFDAFTGVDANRPGFDAFTNEGARGEAFERMKASSIADAKAALGSTFAGGGLNSGLGMEAYGRGLGDTIAGIEYGAYGDAQNRGLQAQGMESNAYANALAQQMQAQGMNADMYNASQNRGLQAQGMNADMYNATQNRGLQAQGMNADMYNSTQNRGLQAQGMNADMYNASQNRQLSAMSMAPMMQGLNTTNAQNQLQVGQIQDQQNQNRINADMSKYYEGQNAEADALSKYANLSAMMGGMGGTSSGSETKPWSIDDTGSVIGGITGFFSDRRLKENIRKVGVTSGGSNVYTYNYIGGNVRHTGPMADEVPHAVIGTINGFSVVDYGKVM